MRTNFNNKSSRRRLNLQKTGGVCAEDSGFLAIGNLKGVDALEHFWDASDLMRVIAAGQNMIHAGERDGQLEGARAAGVHAFRMTGGLYSSADDASSPDDRTKALAGGRDKLVVEPLGWLGRAMAYAEQEAPPHWPTEGSSKDMAGQSFTC